MSSTVRHKWGETSNSLSPDYDPFRVSNPEEYKDAFALLLDKGAVYELKKDHATLPPVELTYCYSDTKSILGIGQPGSSPVMAAPVGDGEAYVQVIGGDMGLNPKKLIRRVPLAELLHFYEATDRRGIRPPTPGVAAAALVIC